MAFPKLYYPELYLMEGGYKAFFEHHSVSVIVAVYIILTITRCTVCMALIRCLFLCRTCASLRAIVAWWTRTTGRNSGTVRSAPNPGQETNIKSLWLAELDAREGGQQHNQLVSQDVESYDIL